MSASPQPAPSRTTFSALDTLTAATPSNRASRPAHAVFLRLLGAWHLLSLDAPTIAAVWVIFIARCAGITLPWTEPAAMFVAVWILYAADRLLDARGAKTQHGKPELEQRHRFHDQHRLSFYAGLGVACPVPALLLRHISSLELQLDVLLGCLLFAWLLLIHLRSPESSPRTRLPKELAVGMFFPTAIFIPCVARFPALQSALLPDALLFAAACSLNCLYIFAWEHPSDRAHAHGSTRWAVQRLPELSAVTLIAGAMATLTSAAAGFFMHNGQVLLAAPAVASAVSAALLLILHRHRAALSPLTQRAAADLCLLTPVPFLLAFSLARLT